MNHDDLLSNLDKDLNYRSLADQAGYSVAQIYRRSAREGVPRPLSTRRRVLLERAAYHLSRSKTPIGEIAILSGFESPDGFARAFRRHYGITPKLYRRLQPTEYRCGFRGGIHYQPGALEVHRQGESMSFVRRVLNGHQADTKRIIQALILHPEVKDIILPLTNPFPWPWEPDDETVKQLAYRCATGPEPWLHSIEGYSAGTWDGDLASLLARLDDDHRRS